MPQPLIRQLDFIGASLAVGLLFIASLLQYLGLKPCPLCWIARWILACSGFLCLISIFHLSLSKKQVLLFGKLLINLLGIITSGWQILLERQGSLGTCHINLAHIIDSATWEQWMRYWVAGSGNCNKVYTFCYLSLGTWTLLAFSFLTALMLWQIYCYYIE